MATSAGAPVAALDGGELARWRAAWAQMMSGFVPGLDVFEQTVCRVAETVAGRAPRRVLDLGGGPGVFAERLARRWPHAEVTVLDVDPVLLELARAALPAAVQARAGDMSSPAWLSSAGSDYELVTVVMTMHYLAPERARALYREAYGILAPGGLLVIADPVPEDGIAALMQRLHPHDQQAAAERQWPRWWNDLARVPALRPLFAQRAALFPEREPVEFTAPLSWHARAAHAAGFAETGVIWRAGTHAAFAAVR